MKRLNKIIYLLESKYESPYFNNKSNPVDELVYIILSKRTNYKCNNDTYENLKKEYPDWKLLLRANREEIYELIKQGGLGREKSRNIIKLLNILYEDFGTFSIIKHFTHWEKQDIFEYLISLPGIGEKSAYCVMLYSLKLSVQPADAHLIRLFYRLGYIKYNQSSHHRAQKEIGLLCENFSFEKNYKIHVNFKAHGQEICKKANPECNNCIIYDYCPYLEDVV